MSRTTSGLNRSACDSPTLPRYLAPRYLAAVGGVALCGTCNSAKTQALQPVRRSRQCLSSDRAPQSLCCFVHCVLTWSMGYAGLAFFVSLQLLGCGVNSKPPADKVSPGQPNAPGTMTAVKSESSAEAAASSWQGLAERWQGDVTTQGTKLRVERDACLHITHVSSTSKAPIREARSVDLERNGTVVTIPSGDALTCFRHEETFILRGKDGSARVTIHGDSPINVVP
jgi:hypothetical protein